MNRLQQIQNYNIDQMAEFLENIAHSLSYIWLPDEKFVSADKEHFKKWLELDA